jgi:murein DD-endopeptidase MepM/ murein hydrolase activator NlpD
VLSETLEEIENLSTKIEEKKNEIAELETSEISLMKFIEKEEALLKGYNEEYEKAKTTLEKRLIVMYEMGDTTYLDVLLSSKSISDFISKYYLLSELSEADYKLVDNVKKSKTQTESVTKTLEEKKEELEKNKEDLDKYQISLSNMEILKTNKLASLSEEEVTLYNEIEEYRNEITNIEAEIKELALKNVAEIYIGGSFVWPTPGYTTITSSFGMRTHPITGIYKLHTGTDIGAPYGANFVAVNDGVVVAARMNSAYGNMVMIDHGGGVVTLYAHGSEICVSEGDIVRQGQTVLKVGDTGYATGPHAHIEIRINGEYIDPMDYLSPDNESQNSIENLLN